MVSTVSESFGGFYSHAKRGEYTRGIGIERVMRSTKKWDLNLEAYLRVDLVRPYAMPAISTLFALALFASYYWNLTPDCSFTTADLSPEGWSDTVSYLAILSVLIGILFSGAANVWVGFKYRRLLAKQNAPPSHERPPRSTIFGWLMSAGMFIFVRTL